MSTVFPPPWDCARDGHGQTGTGSGTSPDTTLWPGHCHFCGTPLPRPGTEDRHG